ncbi:MAG TPA: NAD(P)H-hydrate dehydratase [Balneolaceae bacterium]
MKAPVSHYLLDAFLSREIDQRTQDELGIDSFTLMEIAGSSAAKILLDNEKGFTHGLFLCGKGNNAGDALVVARYLAQHQIKVTIVFLSGIHELSAEAQKNFNLLREFTSGNLTVFENWKEFSSNAGFDFIMDGMLGTGLKNDLRGDYFKVVEWANSQKVPVFSMDIPTGLHVDTGQIMGTAMRAERTFAFGSLKLGFYLESGPHITGTVTYCELPFPNEFKSSCSTFLLDESWVSNEPPTPGEHKYESGVLHIIAGSEGLTGAAVMATKSAWAEGLGAVILICPKGVLSVYENLLPFVIKKPVGSKEDNYFKKEHLRDVLKIVQQKEGKVLLGPGLGRNDSTVQFVSKFLSQNKRDTVIDADGLWCLSQLSNWEKPKSSNWILTPHPGELARLTGSKTVNGDHRLRTVRELSSDHQITVLSKGMPGIIGTTSGKCYLTGYDTRYFARAGSGDVLAGKVGAYLAFGRSPELSCAQALLNGKQKLDHFLKQKRGIPEPNDFI